MSQDMRILMTKRMLKEGLLRTIEHKPLSKISVSELCKQAGVNRATFYNHYDSPTLLLKDIAKDYSQHLRELYYTNKQAGNHSEEQAILACLEYLYAQKNEIKILLSPNAENSISGFGLEIIQERLESSRHAIGNTFPGSYEDYYLGMILTASAAFGLFRIWLVKDIDKSPEEILALLKHTFGKRFFP